MQADAFRPQPTLELTPAAVEAAAQRGLAQSELARGPLVRELFQAAEDQGDAIALGQPFQLVVNQVQTLGIAAEVLRVGDRRKRLPAAAPVSAAALNST